MPEALLALIIVLSGSSLFFGLLEGFSDDFDETLLSGFLKVFVSVNLFGKILLSVFMPVWLFYIVGLGLARALLFLVFIGK